MDKIIQLIKQYKSIIAYLIFGVLTTVINIAAYYLFSRYVFPGSTVLCNVIAWVLAVTFAYLTNRRWVFESKVSGSAAIARECASFFASRVATLLVDIVLMALMFDLLKWNDMLAKIISNVVVVILNYILSKLVVFRRKGSAPKRQLK